MSVLNQASDGLYTVLIVLVRALVQFGPKPRETLIAMCGGNVESVDASHLSRTLTRWTELGLFDEHNGNVVIDLPHGDLLGKTADIAETRLPRIVRTIALSADNNARFWQAENNKSSDLSRGLSWLLAQDIYQIETDAPKKIQALEIQQLYDPSRCILQNDTRWQGLRVWMQYLGFAREGTRMAVDPTIAVRDVLPEVFASSTILTARRFVETLAQLVPVLDQGAYRTEIEDALNTTRWRRPPDGHLSTSLSRALQRLELEGQLALDRGADAKEGVALTGVEGRVWREVTDIRRLKKDVGRQ